MTPIWLTVLLAIFSALAGVGFRAVWEEVRDYRGARRTVVSEMRANSLRLQHVADGMAGVEDTPSDASYRSVQLILARQLPATLWADVDALYSQISPWTSKDVSAMAKNLAGPIADRLTKVADRLEHERFRVRGLG